MADTTKTKVLDVQTGQAVKNVDNLTNSFIPLRKQIKDLTLQLQQLEKGTEEYNQVARQLAEVKQKNIEITEAAKYSNQDFGQVMSNLTSVSMGLVGGLNAISASMALIGGDSESMRKALVPIQLIMAAIQGFSAIDKAMKALSGLKNAFSGAGDAAKKALPAIKSVESEVENIRPKKVEVGADTSAATSEVEKVKAEVESVPDRTVTIDADASSASTAAAEVKEELETIEDKKVKVEVETGDAAGQVEAVKAEIDSIPDSKVVEISDDGAGQLATDMKKVTDNTEKAASTTKKMETAVKGVDATAKVSKLSFAGFTAGIKSATAAMKAFFASNPILLAISAAIAGLAAGIKLLNNYLDEKSRVQREENKLQTEINTQYEEQALHVKILVEQAQNMNKTIDERKKITEELNKIVPEYNAKIDETTGLYTANAEALQNYLDNLMAKIKLEAYEDTIKEKLKEQLQLQEEIKDLWENGVWNVFHRIEKKQERIKQLDEDIERIMTNISNLDFTFALSDNKVEEESKKTTTGVKKQLKEIADAIKDLKKQATDFWDILFNLRDKRRETEGPADYFKKMRDSISQILLSNDFPKLAEQVGSKSFDKFGKLFRTKFRQYFSTSGKLVVDGLLQYGFHMSDILSKQAMDAMDKIEQTLKFNGLKINKIIEKYTELAKKQGGKLTEEQTKRYEAEKKQFSAVQESLAAELQAYYDIIDAVKEYTDEMRRQAQVKKEMEITEAENLNNLRIQREYMREQLEGNVYADNNMAISQNEAEIDTLNDLIYLYKQELFAMEEKTNQNEMYAQEVEELTKKIFGYEQQLANAELELDKNKFEKRRKEVEQYFLVVDKNISHAQEELAQKNFMEGLGTAAYNTAMEQQKILMDFIQEELQALQDEYDQRLIMEEEFLLKKQELERRYEDASQEMVQISTQTKIDAFNAYYNAMNSLSNAIGQILDQEMEKYDQNSSEYKKLAVARAITDTIGGSFSAFISGVQSGIPAPYNFILGGVLATITTAMGIANIAKIKSGSVGGQSATGSISSAASGASTYETTAYATNAELLGSIKDQRVTVLESDITSAQNHVNVLEANSTW